MDKITTNRPGPFDHILHDGILTDGQMGIEPQYSQTYTRRVRMQNTIYLIKKLWIDTMENHDAGGYKVIGFVTSLGEAERITNLEFIEAEKYPWPLKYPPFTGENIPVYIYEEFNKIDTGVMTNEELVIELEKLDANS